MLYLSYYTTNLNSLLKGSKIKSTYDEFVESLSEKEKKEFEQEYRELVLSELLIALMEEDNISVKKLVKEAKSL